MERSNFFFVIHQLLLSVLILNQCNVHVVNGFVLVSSSTPIPSYVATNERLRRTTPHSYNIDDSNIIAFGINRVNQHDGALKTDNDNNSGSIKFNCIRSDKNNRGNKNVRFSSFSLSSLNTFVATIVTVLVLFFIPNGDGIAIASASTTTAATPPETTSSSTNNPIAAHININSIPPQAVIVQDDLPFIGQYISGTYARVDTQAVVAVGNALSGGGSDKASTSSSAGDDVTNRITRKFKQPSVLIQSPNDKVSALKELASNGHLEFDVDGVLKTHLDVDVTSSQPGELTVKFTSPIIPALPFKKATSQTQ